MHALTIFCGAFLLFLVQPLIGKYILPWFGGSPGVWTTCLLFFQTLLLAGYAYAHFTSTRLKPRQQAYVHIALLVVSLLWLPIIPDGHWKPMTGEQPVARILLLLLAVIGLPYLVLAATGPLLQNWFRLTRPGASPYRLYALSNAGSLLALIGYPFLVEPLLTRSQQAMLWSGGMVLFVIACAMCAWRLRKLEDAPAPATTEGTASPAGEATSAVAAPVRAGDYFFWLVLPAIASILLTATTNKVTSDVAVVPFLWVLPLALYLVSFILCFDHPRWYSRGFYAALFTVSCAVVAFLLDEAGGAKFWLQLLGYNAALFAGCMVCHGELCLMKPPPQHLTRFYLCLALGGALGGSFVALAAPAIFSDYHEYPLGIWMLAYLAAILCLLHRSRALALGAANGVLLAAFVVPALDVSGSGWMWFSAYATAFREFYTEHWQWAAAIAVLFWVSLHDGWKLPRRDWHPRMSAFPLAMSAVLGAVFIMQAQDNKAGLVEATRNFYGTLKVRSYGEEGSLSHYLLLSHGVTTHGLQLSHPDYVTWATSYYGPNSGITMALDQFSVTSGRHIGLVGLGTGTLAAYGAPGDRMRFYEINPEVEPLARRRFSFIEQSFAEIKIVPGDARLTLEQELRDGHPQKFDVLALDAFSSDAIPVHLLTREAFGLYLEHMKPDGIIAVHISNRYLNLRPVVEALAREYGLAIATISDDPSDKEWWLYRTTWVLVSRSKQKLEVDTIKHSAEWPLDELGKRVLWTDDYSSLVDVLK